MSQLYPLRFQPTFREYLWGGRRLESVLGKRLGDGETYAESWEVVDHGADQSVVAYGDLAGRTLQTLVQDHCQDLLGRHAPQSSFPLLFKFLDCNKNLSVQVHPNDQQGALLSPPDLGKTEAWYILDAQPGAVLYAGLKQGVSRSEFEREIAAGTVESCLNVIEPDAGDCVFIPAGVMHALGEGLLVAEIQQSSNTTYRLFDWNRVDADGNARELHIDAGLDVTDFDIGPIQIQQPKSTRDTDVEQLVSCDKFVLERQSLTSDCKIGGGDQCHILAVISGEITIADEPSGERISKGQTVLLPAACGEVSIQATNATLLRMRLPD